MQNSWIVCTPEVAVLRSGELYIHVSIYVHTYVQKYVLSIFVVHSYTYVRMHSFALRIHMLVSLIYTYVCTYVLISTPGLNKMHVSWSFPE